MDKHRIEKNSVQETLIIPLYGRWLCSRLFPALFQDKSAAELLGRVDYDFSELEKRSNSLMQVFGALEGPGVKPIHRLLAKIADGPLHLQIVRMEFKRMAQ